MDNCLSLPFDQYQRYKLVSDIINKFRVDKTKFSILEVGAGSEENLKKFLPEDNILLLDKDYPASLSQKEGYIVGDILITKLNQKYDFIIAVDVYEHIPPSERARFLDALVIYSKIATIITGPFDQENVAGCEFFANEVYKIIHDSDHIWLKEHFEYGLPSLQSTIDFIKDINLNPIIIPNGYLPRWFELMSIYLITFNQPELAQMVKKLNEFYNQNFYPFDNYEPAYRHAIIIPKITNIPVFSDLNSNQIDPAQVRSTELLLSSFIQKIIYSAQISKRSQELTKLTNNVYSLSQTVLLKDNELSQQKNCIHSLEQAHADKDLQISELSSNVHSLEQAHADKDLQLNQLSQRIQHLQQQLADKTSEISFLNSRLSQIDFENQAIKNTISYHFLSRFHEKIIVPLFPQGTKRWRFYHFWIKGGRIAISQGLDKAITEFKKYQKSQKKDKKDLNKSKNESGTIATTGNVNDIENNYTVIHLNNQSYPESSEFVPISKDAISLVKDDIKYIAFYLPQFHPIPENDQWWGKGFTEWTNVTKSLPQFIGHYQPHLPGELGFYDLRLPDVQKRQIELARHYGIYGFCFHYYWFNGKKLLERPLTQFIAHKEWDFPFCICWANENWTRRWDGKENDVLIAQVHSPNSDIEFIKDIAPILQDSRYIRIQGKPLLIVYRVSLLPEPLQTTQRWREYCIKNGIGDLYLVSAFCFGCDDPRKFGFDSAVEFPPHSMTPQANEINDHLQITTPQFCGRILDYEEFVKSKKYLQEVSFRLFRTATPGWDNTPRRSTNPTIYYGANPGLFKEWLRDIAELTMKTHPSEERIVFINAWNEWAEGTHLEPDRKFGYGNLQVIADVIRELRIQDDSQKKKIIVVSHDAHPHGAQMIILNVVKKIKEQFHYEIHILLKSGGILKKEFEKYGLVYDIEENYNTVELLQKLIHQLSIYGCRIAITNTVVSGDIVPLLAYEKIYTISLVHELPGIIQDYKIGDKLQDIANNAQFIVFPSSYVKTQLQSMIGIDEKKCVIAPQGLYLNNNFKNEKERARFLLREQFNLPQDAKIILGVGYADFRKGVDIFVKVAKTVINSDKSTFFIWLGHRDESFMKDIINYIEQSQISENVIFPGRKDDMSLFYSGSDLVILTSREDPFPSVILESMDASVPVIGFNNAGGFEELITKETGVLVSYLNHEEMSEQVIKLLNDPQLRSWMGSMGSLLVDKKYRFEDYIYTLLSLLNHNYRKISIIIPNYNYERYLKNRVQSILIQNYPIYEIIFLDDCSSDNSIQFIENFAYQSPVKTTIIKNKVNSGSVFRQWVKGISYAHGDYLWIAEADDLSEPGFLAEVIKGFDDSDVILSYSQSKQIDQDGNVLAPDYLNYTNDVDKNKWKIDYIRNGVDEIKDSLVIKNTIPNISAVIFKKVNINEIFDDLLRFKVVGDWFFYIWLLQKGKISFIAKALNCHRRHSKGVTFSENKQRHFEEIEYMQNYIINLYEISDTTIKKMVLYRKKVRDYLIK